MWLMQSVMHAGLDAACCLCDIDEVWLQLWFMIKKRVFGDNILQLLVGLVGLVV